MADQGNNHKPAALFCCGPAAKKSGQYKGGCPLPPLIQVKKSEGLRPVVRLARAVVAGLIKVSDQDCRNLTKYL